MFRYLSRKTVEYCQIDWEGNDVMKEACECKVEILIATVFNLLVVITLAILFSKEYECLIFFLINSSLRLFSGGTHAKNHFYCILTYVLCMFGCIGLADILKSHDTLMYIISSITIVFSCLTNHKLSARQDELDEEDQNLFHKRCMQILSVYILVVLGICLIDLLIQPVSLNIRYCTYIVCFTLMMQSMSLIMEHLKKE